jgi:hypothetical protein
VGYFLAKIKNYCVSFWENSHYANFQEDRKRPGWKKLTFITVDMVSVIRHTFCNFSFSFKILLLEIVGFANEIII